MFSYPGAGCPGSLFYLVVGTLFTLNMINHSTFLQLGSFTWATCCHSELAEEGHESPLKYSS